MIPPHLLCVPCNESRRRAIYGPTGSYFEPKIGCSEIIPNWHDSANFHIFPCFWGQAGIISPDFSRQDIATFMSPVPSRLKEPAGSIELRGNTLSIDRVRCVLTRLIQLNPPTKPDVLRWLTGKGNP